MKDAVDEAQQEAGEVSAPKGAPAGLIAAVFTPMNEDGHLNRSVVERQAAHLVGQGVAGVFLAGTTGEGMSLSMSERKSLAETWSGFAAESKLHFIVHVGASSLKESRELAAHAEGLQVQGISAVSPSYYRPSRAQEMVDWAAQVAAAAGATPFYLYDIPSFTGISFSLRDYLDAAADAIPTLAGVKYSNPDLAMLQYGLGARNGELAFFYGSDETLLAGLAVGIKTAVGSTYNFAMPIYRRVLKAVEAGDWDTARLWGRRSVDLVHLLQRFGFLSAAKATMGLVGVDCGPPRLPLKRLGDDEIKKLKAELKALKFFDWIRESD